MLTFGWQWKRKFFITNFIQNPDNNEYKESRTIYIHNTGAIK